MHKECREKDIEKKVYAQFWPKPPPPPLPEKTKANKMSKRLIESVTDNTEINVLKEREKSGHNCSLNQSLLGVQRKKSDCVSVVQKNIQRKK